MRWLYLEPILSNEDGELGGKFRKVDQGFRQVTRILEADPRLSALLQSTRLQSMLDSISEQLLACQSALNLYIDEKRSIFPRLYFLSDDDLLELLGQARAGAEGREVVMQTHLKKLFPGTTGVKLGPEGISITALCSQQGETFPLEHPVDIDCPVEVWLKNLETEMRSSLKNMTLKCIVTKSLQEQDPFTLPTQIICLAQNIRFTEQAEAAIASRDLHKLKASIEKENLYYVNTEVEDEGERNKRQALILQCAHYVAVINILIDKNVTSTNNWLWQKQLRFYLTKSKDVQAKMGLAQISYSYEYLGVNTGQFVRTELADECFFILTQSLHLGLVGNPFGPAGTGKTESVKALGGLFGRLVLIFNCDEAMDAVCMGRLLTGLSLCGAWGCFDEFNRLSGDTLAAVSHQLASLLPAIQQTGTATLNGRQVNVSEWCGVAATMNPVGRGYRGRRALPAALERVLRPVAMVQPSGRHLAAPLLAARCVLNADALAKDLHNVFTMASSLLSGQRHYDWGLRALKAAVGSCGAALETRASCSLPDQRATVRRLLALNNMSKLTTHDALRFENILSLVFSDVPVEESSSDPITKAIRASSDNLKLTQNEVQVKKCVELYEQLQQRMGVVIVGPPGSGKTTIRRLLKTALTQQGTTIVEYIICPKAMSRDWLLGYIDQDTRQWTDGVISATALEVSNQPTDVWSWVVCDGDIDPEWVEALNSVLDDNRLLTLPSGWRIQFGANVNFIFETDSLEHASPATVSRMGVILLSEDISCDMDMLTSWMSKAEFDNDDARSALPVLSQVIKKCVQWFSSHKNDVLLKLYTMTLVKQILVQFEYVAQNLVLNTARTSPEEIVYEAVDRSITNIVKENAMTSLFEELSSLLGPPPPPPPPIAAAEWVTESLYMSPRLAACEPMLRACLASDRAHLLIIGPDACAKNQLAEYLIKEYNSTMIAIDCTPILEPSDIIQELKRNNVVRSGGGHAGARGARVTLLVRSLHRARVDAWGTSAVHSFLAQLIEHGGFWSRGDEGGARAPWSRVARLCVVACADSANMAPRLTAALAQYALSEPDDDELLELVKNWLKQNADKNIEHKSITALAGTVLGMYKEISEIFHSRPQYKWNSSHIRRWCENVKWYAPSNTEELIMAISAEANMIFRDRLVTNAERSRFNQISRSYLKIDNEDLYFTCKLKGDGVYMQSVDYGEWHQATQKLINQCLSEYENNVFGESGAEVCSELAVLCPAIARACNGGVVVCVGSAGAGRRAATQLAAASLPASAHFVNHISQFNVNFKNALASALEGTRSLVFVSEAAVDHTTLGNIEALRNALSAHSIPAAMLPTVQNQQLMENIKQNLGVVICLDKQQRNLSELMEKYPLLYNDAHFVWLDRWSDNTLREMPLLVIQRMMKENVNDISKEQLDSIPTEEFVKIHNSLDAESLKAPCRYVNFIKSYFNIINRKKATLTQKQNMLSSGVEALRRARSEVATLQTQATEQEALLSEKQAKANSALDQISATVRANTDKKEEMHALKMNIEAENEKLQIQKKEIEAELASVEPVIAAARSAVGDLRPESLSEVRSLRAPPDVVRDVLEGVLRLMGIADTSWSAMKNFLSKRGVKEDIRCLDASQISPGALESVERLLEKRGASFSDAAARRASAACAPLAAWVRANLAYARALQRVQPLQAHQARLHKNLQEAEDQLKALSSGLASVDQRVSALKEQLGQHTREAAAIEMRMNVAAETLHSAQNLLDQLAHEYTAWENDLQYIVKEIAELNQRSLLAAAYVVYLPDLTEPQARDYIMMWSKFIGFQDTSFSVINFLSSTENQLKWDADGLPSDQSAVKNAVLINQVLETPKCGFTPLLIDPDGEGLAWLKNTLSDVPCDFVSQHSEKLLTAVQYAVRLGRILVITDVDEVHDSWSLLLSGLSASAAAPRLVLQCRDATLPRRLPPQHCSRLSPTHFTPRLDGLTDQLIHYTLQQQNPEISGKTKELKIRKAQLQAQQHELQENLLRDLSRDGDILHDANLLAALNKTRQTNATISKALEEARDLERANTEACAKYAPSARRAAVLTLAVKSLSARWPLVVMPVDAVLETYVEAVSKADPANMNHEDIVKYLSRRIIERVLLALHKKDKYTVVLYLLKQVYDDLMPDKLWHLLIGACDLNEDNLNTNDLKKNHTWIPDDCLKATAKLKMVDEDLYNRLSLQNEELWKQFMSSGDLNVVRNLKLSRFEVAVALAAIRPDSLYRAVTAFVDNLLGAGAVLSSGGARAAGRWARRRPALLLGAHAAHVLSAHADHHALVQVDVEQGPLAWRSALEAARGGGWLVLTVAASPFTRELQAFITQLAELREGFHEEFRMWIVSEFRDIPPLVANACVNVILEAPEGVKNNIMGTLSAWGNYEADPKVVRLHACLAIFHALVQERRAYIPQGWSRWYSWEWGEISACARAARSGGGAALCLPLYAARLHHSPDAQLLRALHARCLTGTPAVPVALPTSRDLQPYASAFSGLPDIDSPQLLGLPANCRLAWEKNAAKYIVTVLKELNTTVSVHERDIAPLKALLSLWKKCMSGSPLLKKFGCVAGGGAGWWGAVTGAELQAAARAARRVHAHLGTAQRKHHGYTMHEVPEEWQLLWAGPSAPDAYIKEFSFRAHAAVARMENEPGEIGYLPSEVDLRSLLEPGRAIWALRAHSLTRLKSVPDQLVLVGSWGSAEAGSCLSVRGLVLSGACAGATLGPAPERAPPHAPAPALALSYQPLSMDSPIAPDGTLDVPVYSNESREDMLFTVRLPLSRSFPRETAVLNAVALFVAPLD